MPSLREMALQRQQEEARKAPEVKEVISQPITTVPIHPAPELEQISARGSEAIKEPAKEITMDTLRGLYWLATPEHIGDKKASRSQLKGRLNDILLTKDGMRTFLASLEKHVFS